MRYTPAGGALHLVPSRKLSLRVRPVIYSPASLDASRRGWIPDRVRDNKKSIDKIRPHPLQTTEKLNV